MGVIRRTTASLNTLSWQGRLVAFVAVLAAIALVWYVLLMAPLARHQRNLRLEAAHKQHQIAALERRRSAAPEAQRSSPAGRRRARIAALEFDIDKLDNRIRRLEDKMIDPKRMVQVLQSLLTRNSRLELVSIQNLAPRPLVDKDAQSPTSRGVQHVFMHGVRIRFKGGYLETLRYLKSLEGLPWRFFWDGMDYDVKRYPDAVGTLVVYTLSMEAGWIGA